ncbi:hypothetical protein ACFQ7Z_09510 [Streptomyces virginiae]|uniref:hypothetical protein n=1 Tax=Streptomyces virginiae TaxID=1961 RepID=UPI0036A658C1
MRRTSRSSASRARAATASTRLDALDGGRDRVGVHRAFEHFVLGPAQEGQTADRAQGEALAAALAPGGYAALSRVGVHLADASFGERFGHGVALMTRR